MAFRGSIALALWLVSTGLLQGQAELRIEDYPNERSYHLNPHSSAAEARALFLDDYGASDWAFAPDWQRGEHPLPLQIRLARGWRLYDAQAARFSKEIFDSIYFPSPEEAYAGYCQVQYRGRRYLYLWNHGRWNDLPFEEAHLRKAQALRRFVKERDSAYALNDEEGFYFDRCRGPQAIGLAFRQKGGWGQAQLFPYEGMVPAVLEQASVSSPAHLREMRLLPEVAADLARLRRKYKIGRIAPVPEEPFALYVQQRKKGRWGLAFGEGQMNLRIPMRYDSIRVALHQQGYIVGQKGRCGFYNYDFQLLLEPQYEALEILHLDHRYGLAVKSEGLWRLYDAFNGEALLETPAHRAQDLIKLWLER